MYFGLFFFFYQEKQILQRVPFVSIGDIYCAHNTHKLAIFSHRRKSGAEKNLGHNRNTFSSHNYLEKVKNYCATESKK